ncbi:MAG: phage holin family protein [Acidobacteriota bacterium]|nr:phage holin family protein [Acidobacteriota bacterium]
MFQLVIQWLLSAIALIVVSNVVDGFHVQGMTSALIAAAIIGLLNATLGAVLKVITFPIIIITFGIFIFVINAMMILMASRLVDGFYVSGWMPAIWGSVVLTALSMIFRMVFKKA